MLVELTGFPCSGKSFIIANSSYNSMILRKYRGIFRTLKLGFLSLFYFINNELLRDIYYLIIIDNYSFYEKIKLVLNITEKYYYHNRFKNINKTIIIDEGVTHILFNILCTDNLKVWNSFVKKDIFHRLPKPDMLILVKTDKQTQKDRLKKRGHKRLNDLDQFITITRRISKYIELNYKDKIRTVSNLNELNNILKNE